MGKRQSNCYWRREGRDDNGLCLGLYYFCSIFLSLFKWRIPSRWERFLIIGAAALLPLFLFINDMGLMSESDEFMQLRKTAFGVSYKNMFPLSPKRLQIFLMCTTSFDV